MTLRIEPVTPDHWDDLDRLFGPNGAYSNCWCTWWTWRASAWDRTSPAERKEHLRAQVEDGAEPGLLAYDGNEPVGWCAVAPRERYGRLTSPRARTYKSPDDRASWVVTCFFVRRDRRGTGVASELLGAVAAFVACHGGTLVEGYPVETTEHGPAAMYTGTADMFRREGFVEAARRGSRPLVRLEVRPRRATSPGP